MKGIHFTVVMLFLAAGCTTTRQPGSAGTSGQPGSAGPLFEFQSDASTRWSSPENKNGAKGRGSMENNGAKGHSNDPIDAGASKVLLDVTGTGMVNRIWITINDRSPVMLRSLRLDMFWDNETKPAVSVPLGDFCLVADPPNRQWAFYRFHIPDPVFFTTDCRVTLQQIGGDGTAGVKTLQREKAPLVPVTIYSGGKTFNLYKKDSLVDLNGPGMPSDGWTNFYRSDDVSATAYFYLDSPTDPLPALPPPAVRTTRLVKAAER